MAESSDRERDGGAPVVEISPNKRYIRFDQIVAQTINGIQSSYKAFDTKIGMEVEWHHINLNALQESEQSRVSQCVNIVKKIQNKYIIEYLACWFGKETRTLNIITTHLDTLQDFISKVKTLRWRIIKKWSKQILRGLDHLHQQKPEIIHRNVTSSHVYIDGGLGTLNIGDLWMATILVEDFDNPIGLSDAMLQQLALGSIAYIAPESFTDLNLTTKVDIYSFGMCLLEMITREEPYLEHKSCNSVPYSREIMTEKIKKKVLSNTPPKSLLRIRHPLAITFIEECLKPVKYRLSASELLLHEFLIPTVDDDREIILDPKSENDDTEVDINDNNFIENNSIIDVDSAIVSDRSNNLKEFIGGRKYVDTCTSSENDIERSNFNNHTIGGELFQQDGIELNGMTKTDVNIDNQHDNNVVSATINGNVGSKNMIESCLPSTISSSFSLNNLNFCCLKDPDDMSEKSERGEVSRIKEPRDVSLENLMNIENRVNDASVPELSSSRILSSRGDKSSSDKSEDSILMSTIDTLGCLSNDASTLQSLSIEDNYDNYIRIDSDLMNSDSNEKPQNNISDIKLGYDQIISNSDRILLTIKERENRLGKVLEDFEQGENVELDRGVYDGRAEEDGGIEDTPLLSKVGSCNDVKTSSADNKNDDGRNVISKLDDMENNSTNKNKNNENTDTTKNINDIQIFPNNDKENNIKEEKSVNPTNLVHKSLKAVIAESQQHQQYHEEPQQIYQPENVKSLSNEGIHLNIEDISNKSSEFSSNIENAPRDLPPKERLDFRSMFIHNATNSNDIGSTNGNDNNDSKNKEIACSLIAIPVENTNELQLLIKIPAAFTNDFSTDKEVEFSFDSVKDDIEGIAEEMILELGLTFTKKELAGKISKLVYSVKVDNISNGSQVFIRRDSSINPSIISNFNSSIESTIIPIATVIPKRSSLLPFGSNSSYPLGSVSSEGEYPKGGEYSLGIISVKSILNSENEQNVSVCNNSGGIPPANDDKLEENERKHIISIIVDELLVAMEDKIVSPGEATSSPNSELLGKGTAIKYSNLFENDKNLVIDNEKIVALNQFDEIHEIETKSEINAMMHTENGVLNENFQVESDVKINPKDAVNYPLHAPLTVDSTISFSSDIPIDISIIEFVTNMVNNVVDIGVDSHIDLIENNTATSTSQIDSLNVDIIDNFVTNDLSDKDRKKKYEINEVSGNVDMDCVQLRIDKDSKTNKTVINNSQQLLKNNLEFQILNGMNLSSDVIIPQNTDLKNTDLNDVDVSSGDVCIIPTDNSKCDEIESMNSNSSDIESKRSDDGEITITNRSSSAGVNNDHPTRLDGSVPSITSSHSINNNNNVIEESLSHSHTTIIDPLHVHTDSLMGKGSSTTEIFETNSILASSPVVAASEKGAIINCSEDIANSNLFLISKVPCIEDLKSFVEEAVIKDADPFINSPLNTSSSDSQISLVSLVSSPQNIDPTHKNIEGNSEKSTADNVAESEAEAQDELDMHKETEKMDRESKIARRAFEQRIQKHKLIQEKCEDDLLKVELEYEKKIAELNRKEESAIMKKKADLFHLNTEMESELKDFKESKKRTFQKLDLELKLDMALPTTQPIPVPAIIQRTFSPPPSPVSKIPPNSSTQVNTNDYDGNNHNNNISNHNNNRNNSNNQNSIITNTSSCSYNRSVVRINSPGIG